MILWQIFETFMQIFSTISKIRQKFKFDPTLTVKVSSFVLKRRLFFLETFFKILQLWLLNAKKQTE